MKFTERQQIILKILINEADYITATSLANVCNSSEKTIRNEINKLNTLQNSFIINSKKGFGYEISFHKKEDFKFLQNELFNMSKFKELSDISNAILDFIASKLLKKNSNFYESECIEQCYISSATFQNYYLDIKKELSLYNLSLNKGINTYYIDGEEKYIRNFISIRIKFNSTGTHNNNDALFAIDGIDINFIEKCITQTCHEYNLYITQQILDNLCLHLCILIKRHIYNNRIKKEKEDTDNPNYKLAKSIYKKISKKYTLNESEIFEIMQYFICNAGSLEIKTNDEKYEQFKQLTQEILEEIIDKTDVNLKNDTVLIQTLTMHLISMKNRITFGIDIKCEFDDEFKKNYLLAYNFAFIAKTHLEKKLYISIPTPEMTLIAIHFCGSLQRIPKKSQMDLLIISSIGISYANLFKEAIINKYESYIEVDTLSLYAFKPKLASKYDYIICHIPLLNIDNSIFVKNFISSQAINTIDILLTQKQNKWINTFFSRDLFITDYHYYKNADDFIQFYVHEFINKKLLQIEDLEQYRQRELSSSTHIGHGAAIPHILKPYGHSFCAVIKLDNPINWNEKTVQLVFFTCCTKKDVQIFSDLCKKIQKFLRKNEFVDPEYKKLTYDNWQQQIMTYNDETYPFI